MNRLGRGVLLLYVGFVVGRLVYSGGYGYFVQTHMRWPLGIAAVLTIILGGSDVVRWMRTVEEETEQRRSVAPTVGWLRAVPLIVLVAVAPTALGAAAASRVDPYQPAAPESDEKWLLPEGERIEMRVLDFINQALHDPNAGLTDREVTLEGLVLNDPSIPDGFILVRFLVSCCAADGLPLKVAVRGADREFANDEWVRATLVWQPPDVPYNEPGGPEFIEAELIDIEVVADPPSSPYESPY